MNHPKFMPTLIENTCEVFKQSLTRIVENHPSINENSLGGELLTEFSKALEKSSGIACREGLKEFIESQEVDANSITHDGKEYPFKTVISKPFLSRFGVIVVSRRAYYHWSGGPGIIPLDDNLGLSGRYVLPDVAEFLLYGAGMLTPKELEGMFGKINHFKPSASLIQDIVNQDGQALHNFINHPDHNTTARFVKAPEEPVEALVASFDGVNVLVREPGKKRGARTKRPGKDVKNGDPLEKSSSYKNAMIGCISFYNSVENEIDFETGEQQIKPNRIDSIYLGRMPEERYPTFKADFERVLSQAEKVTPNGVTKILLMDGAQGFWKYVDENPRYDNYIKVVDFFHAAEHLSRLAEALFGKSSEQGQKWYEKWLSKMKHEADAVSAMMRSVTRYRAESRLTKSREKDINTEVTFFKRNKERMHYNELVPKGLPIGSGPVEAACKMIVKARFCQSGMRWSLQGGQNVMNLRVIQKSEQWEDTWKKYEDAGGYQSFLEAA